jgi:uncharacterized membrane protein YbhN (UPF0104 family)
VVVFRIAKWVIALMVAVGLYFAGRRAVAQWKSESIKLQSQIAEIDHELTETEDVSRQAELWRIKANLEASIPRLDNLRWDRIFLASLLYAIGLVPPSFLLRRALMSLGQHARVGTSIAAQLLGHVGKYVPGKAMVIVLRAGALAHDDVRPLAATISVFLETFLMMAVGAAVAGLVVLWLPVPTWIAVIAVSVAVFASLPTLPPILKRIAKRLSKLSIMEADAKIDMGLFAAGWGWSLLSWVFVGASFTLVVTAIPSATPLPPWIELYAIATAAISLAMVIGFASLLPGGAGVRELVLTTVLGVSIGSDHGLLAAIAARIMFIVVEAILAGGSWLWLRRN